MNPNHAGNENFLRLRTLARKCGAETICEHAINLRLSRELTASERDELTDARARLSSALDGIAQSAAKVTELETHLAQLEAETGPLQEKAGSGLDRAAVVEFNALMQQKQALGVRLRQAEDEAAENAEPLRRCVQDDIEILLRIQSNDLHGQIKALLGRALRPFYHTLEDAEGQTFNLPISGALNRHLSPSFSPDSISSIEGAARTLAAQIEKLLAGEVLFTFAHEPAPPHQRKREKHHDEADVARKDTEPAGA